MHKWNETEGDREVIVGEVIVGVLVTKLSLEGMFGYSRGQTKSGLESSELSPFLLCVNPFVYMMQWLSDSPRLSVTRVCADNYGTTSTVLFSNASEPFGFNIRNTFHNELPSLCA